MKPVVILRPEPGAGRTAARARALGLMSQACPLFRAKPVPWAAPPATAFDALLLTSAQAVRLAGPELETYRALPAYAVGAATAAALHDAGFSVAATGDGDGSAIAARIAADGHKSVLHLSGSVAAPMATDGLHLCRVPVYTMVPLTPPLEALLTPGAVLLVHSAQAGQQLAAMLPEKARASWSVIAISAAAQAACGIGWAAIVAADRPTDDAMLALARRLCE